MSLVSIKSNLEQMVTNNSDHNKVAASHLLEGILAFEDGIYSKMRLKSRVREIMNFYQGFPNSSSLVNACKDLLQHH